jgi:hypothetical protein
MLSRKLKGGEERRKNAECGRKELAGKAERRVESSKGWWL